MTLSQQIATIAILVCATALTRFLPFLVFRGSRIPRWVDFFSHVLPPAVFGMLVVYCMKDVDFVGSFHGLPELAGIAVTVALHAWKRRMLLSIMGGTVGYMLLVQYVFV
jgi:branched-subunit amino acid transport protein AzlD